MILIRENVEIIVESKEEVDRLLNEGWSAIPEEAKAKKPKPKKEVVK